MGRDFFGSLDSANEPGSEVNELLEGKIEVPIECYVMQGENPLPDVVIQKFAKTSGELCRNVFLMSEYNNSLVITLLCGLLQLSYTTFMNPKRRYSQYSVYRTKSWLGLTN